MKSPRYVSGIISLAVFAAIAAAMFWIAGSWRYPFLWAAFGIQLIWAIASMKMLDPDLISERMRPRGKDKDPLARRILSIVILLHYGLAAFDLGHWHISDNVGPILQALALVPFSLGWAGLLWSMTTNKFFSSAIRLQADRGHHVITTGPYHWIRHPGYAFASLAFLSEGIVFGSWLSVLPTVLVVSVFVYRTLLEEQLLTQELPGYKEYAEQVRFRWLPGVW